MNEVYISIDSKSSSTELPPEEDPPSWVSACLDLEQVQSALHNRTAALSITYLDHDEAKELNATYRHKEYATNVLSFPAELPEFIQTLEDGFTLGDLVVCPEVVIREAKEQQKSTLHHFTHLTIHGFLHLLGFDHETEEDAEIMEDIEIKALAKIGIANPYSLNPNDSITESNSNPERKQASLIASDSEHSQTSIPQLESM